MSIYNAIVDVAAFAESIPDSTIQDRGDRAPALVRRVTRCRLLREEMSELEDALVEGDLEGVADAYADMIYIILGSAIAQIGAARFCRVWKEVQRSNMAKVGDDGRIVMREDGKVLKPEGWRPPDIAKAFELPGATP